MYNLIDNAKKIQPVLIAICILGEDWDAHQGVRWVLIAFNLGPTRTEYCFTSSIKLALKKIIPAAPWVSMANFKIKLECGATVRNRYILENKVISRGATEQGPAGT